MSYAKNHTQDDCDKCLKRVGEEKLIKLPFLYKDLNDKVHKDFGMGYHQYYVCDKCNRVEKRMTRFKEKGEIID
jgi:hypothetical protein